MINFITDIPFLGVSEENKKKPREMDDSISKFLLYIENNPLQMLGIVAVVVGLAISICIYYNCRQPHYVYVPRITKHPKSGMVESAVDHLIMDINSVIGFEMIEAAEKSTHREDRSQL